MSRAMAKRYLSIDKYKASMEGIYTTSVNERTIDEAPMAYKSLEDIIDVIHESVDAIDIIRPVYNFKAAEEEVPWKKRKECRNGEIDS